MKNKTPKYKVGIDEVGRGPLAGPVAVGAFYFLHNSAKEIFKGVKESKQLSEEKREVWYRKIVDAKKSGLLNYKVIFQSEKIIDNKGISYAIRKALESALEGLDIPSDQSEILLDGGLYAPEKYIYQRTIIKGDEKEMVIALASICAKVERDRKMNKISILYPEYGFHIHKGYGTKIHRESIMKYGLSPVHRRSFCRNMFS